MIVGDEAGGGGVGLDDLRHFGFFLIGWLMRTSYQSIGPLETH